MELEKAKVGILTMKQHMKKMKVNMGQLKQKMDAATQETERQVRQNFKWICSALFPRQCQSTVTYVWPGARETAT